MALAALRAGCTTKAAADGRVFAAGSTGACQRPVELRRTFVRSDTATSTIMAEGDALPGDESLSLWPGQYVDVEIDLDTRPDAITIPTVALQTGQKGPFVFVVKDLSSAATMPQR